VNTTSQSFPGDQWNGLGDAPWLVLLAGWTLAGQNLLVRLQAAHRYGPGADDASALEAYDKAVAAYLSEVQESWRLARGSLAPPAPRAPYSASAGDFVARLVDDPTNPPAAVFFQAFPGAAVEDGQRRFYLDAGLSAYVDVADGDVLHEQPALPGHGPVGGRFVWLRRSPENVEQLRTAASDAAQVQQQIWSSDEVGIGATDAYLSPFPASTAAFDTDVAPASNGSSDTDEVDIPLPAGWPT
jgi:hypothetical protein